MFISGKELQERQLTAIRLEDAIFEKGRNALIKAMNQAGKEVSKAVDEFYTKEQLIKDVKRNTGIEYDECCGKMWNTTQIDTCPICKEPIGYDW